MPIDKIPRTTALLKQQEVTVSASPEPTPVKCWRSKGPDTCSDSSMGFLNFMLITISPHHLRASQCISSLQPEEINLQILIINMYTYVTVGVIRRGLVHSVK
jgi:hypothetical protein